MRRVSDSFWRLQRHCTPKWLLVGQPSLFADSRPDHCPAAPPHPKSPRQPSISPLQSQRGLSAKISLRARNFNGEKLKVNDKRGNPIEIAAVVVWRVEDTAKAAFDVDDYESYVHIQSESAIRHIASLYAYDQWRGT